MRTSPLRLWSSIGFLCGGLLVWAALFLCTYVFFAIACARSFSQALWLGISVVPSLLVLSGALALGAVYAIARRADGLQDRVARRSDDTRRVVAHVAMMVCGLALIAIAWHTLPMLLTATGC